MDDAAERTSERASGPFFTAPFQTDLSHRVAVIMTKLALRSLTTKGSGGGGGGGGVVVD